MTVAPDQLRQRVAHCRWIAAILAQQDHRLLPVFERLDDEHTALDPAGAAGILSRAETVALERPGLEDKL
jgi:hypothetical protein